MFFFKKGAGLPDVTFRRARRRRPRPDRRARCRVRSLQTDQLALHAFFFLTRERFATDEVAFIRVCKSSRGSLRAASSFVDLVAVERHARFEPQRVARGEAARKHAGGRAVVAGVENLVPDLARRFVGAA
jgi:hypothetical protein